VSKELPAATFVAIPFSCSDGAYGQMLQRSPVGKESSKRGKKYLLFPANFITYSLRLILSSGLFPFNLKLESFRQTATGALQITGTVDMQHSEATSFKLI